MRKFITPFLILITYTVGCNAQQETSKMNSISQPSTINSETSTYIGEAWMEDNQDIVMQLFTRENGISGQATFRYQPNHPQYQDILKHLNGLNVSERKGVLPWPEAK